jgi:hypothetical protein
MREIGVVWRLLSKTRSESRQRPINRQSWPTALLAALAVLERLIAVRPALESPGSVATISPLSPPGLLVAELASIHLDLLEIPEHFSPDQPLRQRNIRINSC